MSRRRYAFSSSDSEAENYPRRRKIYKQRINYENLYPSEFREKFRLRPEEAEFVLERIAHLLQHESTKNKALSPAQQLLTTLHWLGNGSQYHAAGDMHGIVKSTVCRTLKRVIAAINSQMFQNIVKWPEDCSNLSTQFMLSGNFPFVCGCIDGTLINILTPTENEDQFVDRHGKHSLNVMMVCGPDTNIFHVTARWPGCVHDSRVARNSTVSARFENGWRPFPNAVILGDSAYKLKEWLITPYHSNPNDPAEQAFNTAHKRTRQVIERCYGILRKRFPCLAKLRVNPNYAAEIVTACATLHNVATKEDFDWIPGEIVNIGEYPIGNDVGADVRGMARARELLAYFA